MSADDRRASIVAAAKPLVREHGHDVTTRQIADAAGVAEGTLFRVFDDKQAIVTAVVDSVLDSGPTIRAMAAIDTGRSIDQVLLDIVILVQNSTRDIFDILMAVRWRPPARSRHDPDEPDEMMAAVIPLLQDHADDLSIDPLEAARLVRLMVFAGTHPMIAGRRQLTAEEIVRLVLDGIRRRESQCRENAPPAAKSGRQRSPSAKSS